VAAIVNGDLGILVAFRKGFTPNQLKRKASVASHRFHFTAHLSDSPPWNHLSVDHERGQGPPVLAYYSGSEIGNSLNLL